MRNAILFLSIGVVTALAWLAWRKGQSEPFVVSGFVETDVVRVGSRVGGRVAEVWIEEGQTVTKGARLFRLDPFDAQERLAQGEARHTGSMAELNRLKNGYRAEEIEQAAARRDRAAAHHAKLVAGPRPAEIEIARQRLNVARADLELAQVEYDRLVRLRSGEQAAKLEFDQADRALKANRAQLAAAEQELALLEEGTRKEDLAEARAALDEAEHALNLLKEGFRIEEIAEAEARAAEAKAEVDAVRVHISELTVVSPCDCSVEAVDLHPGDLVTANAPTVSLIDTSKLWVRTYVPERSVGGVKIGQRVPVRVSAGGGSIAGQVTFIAREAEFTPRNIQTPEERSKQVFRVKVSLTPGLASVRVGTTVDVLFGESTDGG